MTTFKSHSGIITCLKITLDSKILISGSEDGQIQLWDMVLFKLIKSIKVGTPQASFPISIGIRSCDRQIETIGIAVGLLNKTVKYFRIDTNQQQNI